MVMAIDKKGNGIRDSFTPPPKIYLKGGWPGLPTNISFNRQPQATGLLRIGQSLAFHLSERTKLRARPGGVPQTTRQKAILTQDRLQGIAPFTQTCQ